MICDRVIRAAVCLCWAMAISPAPVEAQGITSQRDKYGNLVRNNGLANAPRPMTNSARPAPTPQFSVVKTPRGRIVIRQH